MKLAILSDVHDNLPNLEKCLNWVNQEQIKYLVFCGDLTNSETLKMLATKFLGQVYMIHSDKELYDLAELAFYNHIHHLGRYGVFILNERKFGVAHEPSYLKKIAASDPDCDFIFYGHTHKPWDSMQDGIRCLNPGNLAGTFYPPTFAVLGLETMEPELKILSEI